MTQQAGEMSLAVLRTPKIYFELGRPIQFNRKVGLFSAPWRRPLSYTIEIPFYDPIKVASRITEHLKQIKGVQFTFNEKEYKWSLEYKKKPIESFLRFDIYDERRELQKRKNGILCARKAIDSPSLHLVPDTETLQNLDIQEYAIDEQIKFNNDYDNYRPISINYDARWAKIDIWLLYYEPSNILVIDCVHNSGDKSSFYLIKHEVFKTVHDPRFLNWIKRYNYLMFTEGIPMTYSHSNKCLKYLCDEMVMREICQFL